MGCRQCIPKLLLKYEKFWHESILGLKTRRINNEEKNLMSLYTDQFQS